ncbi:MAG TPA: hypothetical protein VHZ76_10300 [Gammaproteobacteria bacterium]|jgi:hypothetical protein|nr:hypothetical protein [Gammaproteobacteria bacterium]
MGKLAAATPCGIAGVNFVNVQCILATSPEVIAQVLIHNESKVRRGADVLGAVLGKNLLSLPGHKPSKPTDEPSDEKLW